VGVHHETDVGAETLARLPHARRRILHAAILKPDPHLHRPVAALDVLPELLADAADGRPAA